MSLGPFSLAQEMLSYAVRHSALSRSVWVVLVEIFEDL